MTGNCFWLCIYINVGPVLKFFIEKLILSNLGNHLVLTDLFLLDDELTNFINLKWFAYTKADLRSTKEKKMSGGAF